MTEENKTRDLSRDSNGYSATRGYSQKNWAGVIDPLPKTLSQVMTKICHTPYPIYDLTINSKSYLWPNPWIKTLFQTGFTISSLLQTNVNYRKHYFWRAFVDFLFDNDEEVSSQKHTHIIWLAGDVKEPTHLSERVGDEIPGVVVWPCFMGWCFT